MWRFHLSLSTVVVSGQLVSPTTFSFLISRNAFWAADTHFRRGGKFRDISGGRRKRKYFKTSRAHLRGWGQRERRWSISREKMGFGPGPRSATLEDSVSQYPATLPAFAVSGCASPHPHALGVLLWLRPPFCGSGS